MVKVQTNVKDKHKKVKKKIKTNFLLFPSLLKRFKLFSLLIVIFLAVTIPVTVIMSLNRTVSRGLASTNGCSFSNLSVSPRIGGDQQKYYITVTANPPFNCLHDPINDNGFLVCALNPINIMNFGNNIIFSNTHFIETDKTPLTLTGYLWELPSSFKLNKGKLDIACDIDEYVSFNKSYFQTISQVDLGTVICNTPECGYNGTSPVPSGGSGGNPSPIPSYITNYQCGPSGLGRCATANYPQSQWMKGYKSVGSTAACTSQMRTSNSICLYPYDQCAGTTGLCSAPNIPCTGSYTQVYVDNNPAKKLACQNNGLFGYKCCLPQNSGSSSPSPQTSGKPTSPSPSSNPTQGSGNPGGGNVICSSASNPQCSYNSTCSQNGAICQCADSGWAGHDKQYQCVSGQWSYHGDTSNFACTSPCK